MADSPGAKTPPQDTAPVTLDSQAAKSYQALEGAEHAAEFMTVTFPCTDAMKETCPAVVHVDGTARPQIIRKERNPGYYRILEEYNRLTGIPTLINTSFNIHEEPIVMSPGDALRALKLSDIDHLAIGKFLCGKK